MKYSYDVCGESSIMKTITSYYYVVLALDEEKKAAMIERKILTANYQKHLEIEKEQQETKRKVTT